MTFDKSGYIIYRKRVETHNRVSAYDLPTPESWNSISLIDMNLLFVAIDCRFIPRARSVDGVRM